MRITSCLAASYETGWGSGFPPEGCRELQERTVALSAQPLAVLLDPGLDLLAPQSYWAP